MNRLLWILPLIALLPGCGVVSPSATPYDLEGARAFSASLFALAEGGDSAPVPTPSPANTECENCHGTGVVGDGRIEMECPVCNGTGKTTAIRNAAMRLAARPAVTLAIDKPILAKPVLPAVKERLADKRTAAIDWLPFGGIREAAADTGKPALVYWTTSNCVWCRRMEKNIWSDPRVAALVSESFVAAKVNTGSRAARSDWKVSAYPTTFAVTSDWTKKRELKRVATADEFLALLEAVLASHAKHITRTNAAAVRLVGYTPAADACDNQNCACADCTCVNCACGLPTGARGAYMDYPIEMIEEQPWHYEPMQALRGEPIWYGGNWNSAWNACGPGGCR